MLYTAYLSISPETSPLWGSCCLPDHNDEPGKMRCVPILGLDHGRPARVEAVEPPENTVTVTPLFQTSSHFKKPPRPASYKAFEKRGVWLYDDRRLFDIQTYVRKHEDLSVVIPLEKNAVALYDLLCRYSFLKTVELYFYRYDEALRRQSEYFRFTLEHVLPTQVRQWFDHVKDARFERRGAMLELAFRYQRITWLHHDGYLVHTDEWDEGFDDADKRDFNNKGYVVLGTPASDEPVTVNFRSVTIDESAEPLAVGKKFSVRIDAIISRKFEHTERKKSYLGLALFSRYKSKEREMNLAGHDTHLDNEGFATGTFPPLPVNRDWEADPEQSPDEPAWYRVRVENRHAPGFGWSEWVAVPKPPKKIRLPWFIDCHAHFFAPKASPLPTIWVQHPVTRLLKPSWETIESAVVKRLMAFVQHDLPEFAPKTTETLGAQLMDCSDKVLKDNSLEKFMGKPEERKRIVVGLGIDMEMGHYGGYEGKTVYLKDENGRPGYYMYEKEGERKWRSLTKNDLNQLLPLKKQCSSSLKVFSEKNGFLLTFFPFDPRRWCDLPVSGWWGTIRDPFDYVLQCSRNVQKLKKGSCSIGFKLYTALGYRPDDYKPVSVMSRGKIPHKKKLDAQIPELREFYLECSIKNIPITCHCSRGGIFAHDFMLYYDYLFGSDEVGARDKKEFFQEYFVSPFAWERVLQDYPSLHLCLAHFGGEEEWNADEDVPMLWADKCAELAANPRYPNFYLDLAYCTFKDPVAKKKLKKMLEKHPKLKEKLLFGTDWYLIGSEAPKFGKYENYFKGAFEALHWIDPELPAYTMALNPKRFLNLEVVAKRIAEIWGEEYAGLLKLVKDTIPNTIEKFYV